MPRGCDNGFGPPCDLSLEELQAVCAARPPGSGAYGWDCCSCNPETAQWSVTVNDCPPVPARLDAGVTVDDQEMGCAVGPPGASGLRGSR